jgi:hypothetical protein
MAYDAATGTVVLFGGNSLGAGPEHLFADTWTWDGTTWTEQAPAASPPARDWASMAYDAASGTVVLFGGDGTLSVDPLGDTWTWNGTTWTKQIPAASPPARWSPSMAYDAATSTVVLFGGGGTGSGLGRLGDTWTWNGTTWSKQAPAVRPPARAFAAMAYDAATSTMVLFGGETRSSLLGDTWTWDGTTWTPRTPAAHPRVLKWSAMAYDAATSNVVLFGGQTAIRGTPTDISSTWTWG